jgi:hypothetical protein
MREVGMHAVRNSARGAIVALMPLAAVQAVMLAMSLLAPQGAPVPQALPAPDRVLASYATQLEIACALLFAGHLLLQRIAIGSRIAYALMGGVMAGTSYAIVLRAGLLLSPPDPGSEITAGLLPTFAGMMTGFLYCQIAGLAAVRSKLPIKSANAPRRFDGPIRIRTSIAATAIAAVIPAALTAIISLTLLSIFMPGAGVVPVILAALPAQIFLTALIATVIPAAIFIVCTHHIARALHRSRGSEYAVLAGLVAAACSVVIAPFAPFTSVAFVLVPAVIYGAIMGALYRRFAGIEPVPLPEPVIVADHDSLVPADHPSRQGHVVVFTES